MRPTTAALCIVSLFPVCLASGEETQTETTEKQASEYETIDDVGPFPIRFIDSLSLLFYQATPSSAETLPVGKIKVSTNAHYASLSTYGLYEDNYRFVRDHELLRLEFRGRWGIFENLELECVIPFHYASNGFLDDFISGFHDATGTGPTERLLDEGYYDFLEYQDQTLVSLSEGVFSLADIPITLKYAWLRDGRDPLGLAFRTGLELPTGSVPRSFGNGKIDGSVGVVLQKSWGDFSLFAGVDACFQNPPDSFLQAGVKLDSVVASGHATVAWRALSWLTAIGQLYFGQKLLPAGEGDPLTRERLIGGVGLQAAVANSISFRFMFLEELISGPVFDVAIFTGLSIRF